MDKELTMETFLLDAFDGITPQRIEVEFLRWIRAERRFDSPELLKAQIFKDVGVANRLHRQIESLTRGIILQLRRNVDESFRGKAEAYEGAVQRAGVIAAAAMDQRGSLAKSLASAKGVPQDQITDEMMQDFKIAVTRVLTPHASAILLDPEWGIPAAEGALVKNAGLLLAYEESGYDNTQPGRLPDLLPHVSVKRIKEDLGADAVKILIYYTPFDDAKVNDIKHAFIERIGAECEAYDIPFFLEFVGYDPSGGDEKGLEFAKKKPRDRDRRAWRSSPSRSIKWTC